MLAFKHNAGSFGTPRTLASDAQTTGGPISLHTAIGTSDSTRPPGVTSYVDALSALVPAEVLALHAALLTVTTTTVENPMGEVVTTITEPGALSFVFWGLIVLCFIFYFAGHQSKEWDKWDYARMFIPPFAFVGWTMAQKSTAFDAVWPDLPDAYRSIIAAFGAVLLGLAAAYLARIADQKVE
jgi:hypothetical protein